MSIKDLLSETIIPLKPSDSSEYALELMDEFRVSHLPVVDRNQFLGLISDTDIFSLNNPGDQAGHHLPGLDLTYITENQHIFDVISIFSTRSLTLVPVVSVDKQYIGSITSHDMVRHLSTLFALNNPGGVIILEMNEKDFYLTEIANIVESNDAKVLNLLTNSFPDSTKLEVTLKLNRMDITPVLQTFERYNYSIKASFSENLNMDTLKDRFDSLMKYLNI